MAGDFCVNQETYLDNNEVWFKYGKKCCSVAVKPVVNPLYWPLPFRTSTHVSYLLSHGVKMYKMKCVYVNVNVCVFGGGCMCPLWKLEFTLVYVKKAFEKTLLILTSMRTYWFRAFTLLLSWQRTSSSILSIATFLLALPP